MDGPPILSFLGQVQPRPDDSLALLDLLFGVQIAAGTVRGDTIRLRTSAANHFGIHDWLLVRAP